MIRLRHIDRCDTSLWLISTRSVLVFMWIYLSHLSHLSHSKESAVARRLARRLDSPHPT